MCQPEVPDGGDRIERASDQVALRRLVSDQIPGHAATILESLPDALVIVDRDGRIALVNEQAEIMFGYLRDELIGQPIEVLVTEPLRAVHRTRRARYMDRPEVVRMGTGLASRSALRKDGTEFPVDVSLSPLRTDAGLLIVCTARDVTERVLAARATEMHLASERIVSAILCASLESKSLDELLATALDALFSIPWIAHQSKGAVFLMDDSSDTLVLRAQRGLGDAARAACATVPVGSCICGLAARTRELVFVTALDERHTTRYDGITAHGHYGLPIMSDGRLLGVMSLYLNEGHVWTAEEETFLRSVADVLAGAIVRLQLTDDLRKSEERFALAVTGTDAGIWDWEVRENRIFFSPRWKSMLGYGEKELEDDFVEWERRVHPDDRVAALSTLGDYLEGKRETYEVEHRLLHRDGSYRWILSRGSAVRDANGRPYRMVGSHLDITPSKNAEDAIRANTAKLIAAQRIQEHLLPRVAPVVDGFDIAGRLYPAEFAAGDHFDYLPMEGDTLGIVIGDVSGHGFDSALIMASVHAYLRLLTQTETDVAEVLRRTSTLLSHEIEPGRYVTIILGRLDPRTGTVAYVNAGHPAASLLDARGRLKASLASTCLPAGIFADAPIPDASTVTLAPGDILVCTTDGVTEAESDAGVPFGTERVLDVVRSNAHKSASEIIDALWQAMGEFCNRSKLSDDATAVVVRAIERTTN